MKTKTIEQIGLKWGMIVFGLLAAYFYSLLNFDLIHNIELRLFNGVLMFFGVHMAIKEFKNSSKNFNYFMGLGTGVLTAFVASTTFTLFGLMYLSVINPEFITSIQQNEPFGIYMNKWGAVIQIFIEGTFSGAIMSYANMQFLKKPRLSAQKANN